MAMKELRGRWHRRAAAVLVIAGLHLPVAAQDPDVAQLVFPEGRETYTVDDDIVIRFDPQAAVPPSFPRKGQSASWRRSYRSRFPM